MVQESRTDSSSKEEDSIGSAGKRWVSLQQFATIVGVTYQTACRYRDDGKIQTVKVGGRFRITMDELDRFQKEGNSDKG